MRGLLLPWTVMLCILPEAVGGQNLVANGSFEDYSICPDNGGQLDYAIGWEVNAYTPEYFNACASGSEVGVPTNIYGHQEAATGVAYAGIITYSEDGLVPEPELHREHFGRYLSEPLAPGIPVHLSFKVSPALFGQSIVTTKWTCRGVGMRFTMGPLDPWNPLPPTNSAALYLEWPVLDTSAWLTVSGTFVPDSAYEYIIIGNFFSDSLSTPALVDSTGNFGVAYTYIDDICVSVDPGVCDVGSGLTESVNLINDIWPNPATDLVSIELKGSLVSPLIVELFDATGILVMRVPVQSGCTQLSISLAGLPVGLFYVKCVGSNLEPLSQPVLHTSP